jgi:ABC-type multidrug transport system fused ATPase/permease subunit
MIAHKLETAVQYCDKILVMDQGSVAEYDTPANLLKIQDGQVTGSGIFAAMVNSLNEK